MTTEFFSYAITMNIRLRQKISYTYNSINEYPYTLCSEKILLDLFLCSGFTDIRILHFVLFVKKNYTFGALPIYPRYIQRRQHLDFH